ncbi:broad-specificity cellobiase [Halanaerobium saccharolyticum]|uniref:Beta-glucosidase n=1 Tax=Halanaerobium saccharolyticum TaxID=43595 RepID=A0A4R7Z596_9FIRM|nr:GH1 family beta-glucosidase [Halanaerobium saccharolyticum]RAK07880.1 broad-specificity cellobiase [Halanaerobium saccharolyticum]TDW04494.1 broad-specificity cellobiase [Halanaerobium saccharolyticum]TDX59830.1 broad-specificity cellobiase [Halanaerobium saccharolyticum]
MAKIIFPEDFEWGAATASYQIEGAYNEDGKGESIWDRFTHQKGNIVNNDTGDVACDHYHRYQEDVELMKELGLDSYRFSIAWPRILPAGKGKINQKGIDFYKSLVDQLLKAGIEPSATLYHWDLPQKLQDNGGWENRDTAKYFDEYAQIMYRELGDLIPRWITHNEPMVVSMVGNLWGEHAPGFKDYQKALQVAHNVLLSHGMAVKSFRESGIDGEVGITINLNHVYPDSDSREDQIAKDYCDAFNNRWFLDPVLKGKYPEKLMDLYQNKFDKPFEMEAGDLKIISREIDFLGINYYSRALVEYDESEFLNFKSIKPEDSDYTAMDWEVYPQGLTDLLKRLDQEYTKKPIFITENGAAYDDQIAEDGRVHDQKRVEYLEKHFQAAHQAIEEGVNLAGYYVWSLMDNFEWAFGYDKRFGIIYIDYENNQKRILKDSALLLKDVIEKNGLEK